MGNSNLVTFGFPESMLEGLNGKCEIIGTRIHNGCPVLQLRSSEVTFGFSGAPVLNLETNRIIGMINAIITPDNAGREGETALALPVDILAGICPEIENISVRELADRLASQKHLGDLFVNLSGKLSRDAIQNREGDVPAPEKLGLDPLFGFMENASPCDTQKDMDLLSEEDNVQAGIMEELGKYDSCVLIGEAGAGKTTTLERLVLDAAKKRLEDLNAPLPAYLKLSAWKGDQSPEDFILANWPFAVNPRVILPKGGATLYLDGLNEIEKTDKGKIRQLRNWLHSEQGSSKFIITCRVDDYLIGGLDLGFPVVKLERMGISRIRQFAAKYSNAFGRNDDLFIERIIQPDGKDNVSSLRKLASNPFMLTALIIAYINDTRDGTMNSICRETKGYCSDA